MYHWTDCKIRIHAFYCLLGIFCLRYVHRQAKAARADHSVEKLIEELQQIQQFVLLHPRQGEKGPEDPDRAAEGKTNLTPQAPCTQLLTSLVTQPAANYR